MKTIKQEWKEKGNIYGIPDHLYARGFEDAIDLFKAALKKEVKKRIQKSEIRSGRKRELEFVLDLIDQVKPKQ